MKPWKPLGWDMEGEEYKDSWRRLPSAPRAHHILWEADVHTVSLRQGVTQAVTEMHMKEEILISTKAKASRIGSTWAGPWRMQLLVLGGRGGEKAHGTNRTSYVICRT